MTTENLPEAPEKVTALEVYQTENGLDPWIAKIRKEVESFVPDVTTKKGRDAIASIAYKVAKSKTALNASLSNSTNPDRISTDCNFSPQ